MHRAFDNFTFGMAANSRNDIGIQGFGDLNLHTAGVPTPAIGRHLDGKFRLMASSLLDRATHERP